MIKTVRWTEKIHIPNWPMKTEMGDQLSSVKKTL